MKKRPLTNGGPTNPKRRRDEEWNDEDLLTLNEYKRLHKVLKLSASEEIRPPRTPQTNFAGSNKMKHEKDGWSSEVKIPLKQLIAKWRKDHKEGEKKQEGTG